MLKMMFWDYRDDNNCWDYVRFWLNDLFNVPKSDLPKYGFLPTQKKELNQAHKEVEPNFYQCERVDGAIACKYRNGYLYHVGLCYKDKIYHVKKSKTGVCVDTLKKFKKNAEIKFYAHKSL